MNSEIYEKEKYVAFIFDMAQNLKLQTANQMLTDNLLLHKKKKLTSTFAFFKFASFGSPSR